MPMKIEKLSDPDGGLDQYRMPEGYDPGDSLVRAADLLYGLLDRSYRCSRDALAVDVNGHDETVQSIYWKCKELLDKIGACGEKAGFLAMSAVEQCWGWSKPLVLLRLEELMDPEHGLEPIENARELDAILADNPYKKIWAERSALYVSILERIGFDPGDADFSDLTTIMDPLLDALTFYHPKDGKPFSAYRVRTGPASQSKSPLIARAMCMFRSEKEIVDAAMSAPADALLMFAGMEKTHAQVKDYFYEWFHGYPEERQRNYMRNDSLTPEQYLALGADYTRIVYLCVKSGGTAWLVPMPWKGDMYYGKIGSEKAEYYYGKRASYAPYQIFYKSAPKAPDGSSMLAVKKDAYMLNELLDSLSMAWFPAFMDETIRHFFRDPDVAPKDILLPEETAAGRPDGGDGEYAIVPVYSGVPALCTWEYRIQEPQAMFGEPWMLRLLEYFGVASKDLDGVPILPTAKGTADGFQDETDGRARQAYVRVLAGKIAAFMDGRWDARRWILQHADANRGEIIKMAGDGDLTAFMSVTVDGTPNLDENGNPKTVTMDRYPYSTKQSVQKTEMGDGRDEVRERSLGNRVYWASAPTSSRPPVVWKLRPYTAEHYALLAGCGTGALPEILKLSGDIAEFNKKYADRLPGNLSNKYVAAGYGDQAEKSVWCPCLCPINICMTKKALNQYPYFHTDKKKKK